ncbi:27075_t:CDS:2, partial [Dentiscutata erythropus]
LSKWRMIMMNPSISISNEETDIKRKFIFANDEIKVSQIPSPKNPSSMYTSRSINTKEIKQAYESFRDSQMCDLDVRQSTLRNVVI